MSFGGTVTRGKRNAGSSGARGEGARRARATGITGGAPAASAVDDAEIDWERVAVFSAGIALGAALGAGVALLFAPYSGEETRAAILRQGSRLAHEGRDVWDDLSEELQWAAKRGKRRFGRRVQRARWAAEDFMDDRRRPDRWWGKQRSERKAQAQEKASEPVGIDEQAVQEIVDSLC